MGNAAEVNYSVRLTADEREALRRLSVIYERRPGETLRAILRAEARKRNVWVDEPQHLSSEQEQAN
jgi:hypothetical protein